MKTFCIILLLIGALVLEVNLFIDWYFPHMDYKNILLVYGIAFFCRIFLYALILAWFERLWDKYLIKRKI